jgi:hypothetical protein
MRLSTQFIHQRIISNLSMKKRSPTYSRTARVNYPIQSTKIHVPLTMKRTQRLLPIRAFCKIGRISLIYQTINMFLNRIGDATTRTRKGTVYLFMEAGTHGKHSIDPIRSHVLKSFPFADQKNQIVGQVWGLLKFPRSFSTRTG